MKTLISSLAVATLATVAPAQQIDVTVGGGWTVTPVSQSTVNSFNNSNPTNTGVIIGEAAAHAGSSLTPGGVTRGAASVQGYCISGATVSGSTSATAGVTEFYTNAAGNGQVDVTLNAQPEGPIARLRGAGYQGQVTAIVRVTCPYFGWLTARCITNAVAAPQIPFIMTVPVSATASASNQSNFNLNLNAGATVTGTLPAGSAMQLFAGANATGDVVLQ